MDADLANSVKGAFSPVGIPNDLKEGFTTMDPDAICEAVENNLEELDDLKDDLVNMDADALMEKLDKKVDFDKLGTSFMDKMSASP